jgi:copper homeostasis protein
MLLEVIVQSVEDAVAAQAGGADRLEVVREIDRDGLTPSIDLVRSIASATRLPLRIMIRESDGFTITGAGELDVLRQAAAACADLGVDGIVVGFARGGALDVDTTAAVLSAAPRIAATFHRAFDRAVDPFAALEALRGLPQIDRVLTGGGTGDWTARCQRLEEYVARAAPGITILAGGDVDAEAVRVLAHLRAVSEVHVGRAAREPQQRSAPVSSDRVRRLRELLQ